MGASDDKILERAILAVTRLQAVARGRACRRTAAQLRRNSDARRLMELMGVPALAPTRPTQAEVPQTPQDSPRVAVPTPDARPPAQPATYVMPPLPPGPPPLPPGPPPQPSQLVQPPLPPLSAPSHYSMPGVPPPVPPPMPPPVPAASQSMHHSAAMLSVPAATPQKLDFSGLGQPGSCSMNSPACATELQSPQTHWTTRLQSRLHPADMTAPNGMSLSPLQRMSAAVMHTVELSPQERLLTAVVMQRFCRWGEHRTIGDWPAELRAYGPLPAIHDALRASRTRSLTLPQLVTAIKERTGGCAGGKALDMLNLKAYIRCFPETFHMRSGRTAAGRPLDLVVLGRDGAPADCLGEDAEDMGALAASAGRHVNAPYGLASAGVPMPPPHLASSSCSQPSFAARPAAASQSVPVKLQPKELFSGPTGAQPLWGNALGGFSLFGEHAGSPSRADNKENANIEAGAIGHDSPRSPSARAACAPLPGSSQHAAPSHLELGADPAGEPRASGSEDTMLYQIKGLFVDGADDDAPTDAVEQEQRRKYIEAHDLDRLFLQAVDRAREQSAASPAEFVGRELARLAACQHATFEAEPRQCDPAELRHCALSY